ncbi:MAG: glucosamine-6-phosphate deaminase [Verrucomicrobiales bacterium]|jgi:glucosamine-6-phosphate deaminase|nr:glucosamine-6-phosphate deaminase [Verrucomicrobiales bacterium]
MEIIIQSDADAASLAGAAVIDALIRRKPAAVLGLATGSTPLTLYRELVRRHREEGLDFSRVTTFNLDEYLGLAPAHPASYHFYMRENFFHQVNLSAARAHLPDGLAADVPAACRRYEEQIAEAGGIDLQVLGIGADGHIGFNEPSSSLASRTRVKTLTMETLRDNARHFTDPGEQPRHVITMGVGTIMDARAVLLFAFGAAKARAVAAAVEGPVTASVPASALQLHPRAVLFLDEAAAGDLRRREYYRWVYEHKPDWQRF